MNYIIDIDERNPFGISDEPNLNLEIDLDHHESERMSGTGPATYYREQYLLEELMTNTSVDEYDIELSENPFGRTYEVDLDNNWWGEDEDEILQREYNDASNSNELLDELCKEFDKQNFIY